MSIMRSGYTDVPTDYQGLWLKLRIRIEELIADQATKAMTADTDVEIRQKQGAYLFGYTVLSEMGRMLDEERAAYGVLRRQQEDDTA